MGNRGDTGQLEQLTSLSWHLGLHTTLCYRSHIYLSTYLLIAYLLNLLYLPYLRLIYCFYVDSSLHTLLYCRYTDQDTGAAGVVEVTYTGLK